MEFDRTESAYTEDKIEESQSKLQIGTVVTVFEHTKEDDNSNFECNILLRDEEKERRRVKIMSPGRSQIQIPSKGDVVVVGFLEGQTEDPIILGHFYNIEDRPPLGKSGMYRLRRGELYSEADPDGDWIRLAKKSSDDGSPEAAISIDDSGNDPIVKVSGENSPMGLRLNLETGEFKIRDGSGYGIESDGSGNFVWHHENVNFKEGSTMDGW